MGATADGGSHGGNSSISKIKVLKAKSKFILYKMKDEELMEKDVLRECGMRKEQYTALRNSRFTKFMCPFGIVVAGTELYPEANLHYAANVVGSLLDPDNTGKVKDEDIRREMSAAGYL